MNVDKEGLCFSWEANNVIDEAIQIGLPLMLIVLNYIGIDRGR